MPIEKSLTTLLRALQSASSQQDISRYLVPRNRLASQLIPRSLLGSAARLLALLSNPSNVTLLTSQILAAPAIWGPSTNLQIIGGVITIFRSASYHLSRLHEVSHKPKPLETPRSLGPEEWTTAIVKGTDGASPRARQVLVLSGLLQGFHSRDRNGLSTRLQDDLLISVNLSLRNSTSGSHVIDRALVIAVSQVFDFLDIRARHTLDHDLLLPTLIEAVFFSEDGIHQGYFLGTIDADVSEAADRKFDWSARSTSYLQLQSIASGPLVADLGRLSRLAAFSAENARDPKTLIRLLQDLFELSRSLCVQWRQNKLSEVDKSEETLFLADDTLRETLPLLWRVLRSSMFSVVIILTAYTGRILSDKMVAKNDGL